MSKLLDQPVHDGALQPTHRPQHLPQGRAVPNVILEPELDEHFATNTQQQQQPEATTEETRLATSLSSPTDDADIE